MMQKNRNYITLKGFAIIIAMIIIAAIGVRIFLRTNFKQDIQIQIHPVQMDQKGLESYRNQKISNIIIESG